MKRLYVVIVIMVFLFLGAVSWGTVAQINVSNKESDLRIKQNELLATESALWATQDNLVSTESELANANIRIEGMEATLQTAQNELSDIKTKYPPHEFTDANELQEWVNSHEKPTIHWYDDDIVIANDVVLEGITDGYLMFVNVWIFADLGYDGVAILNTYVDGELYWWRPDETEIHKES